MPNDDVNNGGYQTKIQIKTDFPFEQLVDSQQMTLNDNTISFDQASVENNKNSHNTLFPKAASKDNLFKQT